MISLPSSCNDRSFDDPYRCLVDMAIEHSHMTDPAHVTRGRLPARHPWCTPSSLAAPDLSHQLETLLENMLIGLPIGAKVVDYGCHGWRVAGAARQLGRPDLDHIGVDLGMEPEGRPPGARFLLQADRNAGLPALDADLLVASHVLEHCQDPVRVFGMWLAAVRAGGAIYVEAPSEQTAMITSDLDVQSHRFDSFWDDPTHVRPWPAAALYRLALSWGAIPELCGAAVRHGIHCGIAVVRRISDAPLRYRYISLRDVQPGLAAALAHAGIHI
jgi:hypothetical protein